MFTRAEVERFHAAAKIIELDGVEGVRTCAERFGKDVAGALLVAFIRRNLNPNGAWPTDKTKDGADRALVVHGLILGESNESDMAN